MSTNRISANDVVKYLGTTLNIDMTDKLIVLDMLDDLKTIEDLASFRIFIKERFNYERFRYLTGYQKFISLVNEFKKENAPILDEAVRIKADNYKADLFSRLTFIVDEINFELQIKSKKVEDLDLTATLSKNGLTSYDLGVIAQLGSKNEVFKLCIYGKEELSRRIESIVNKRALAKYTPQIENKNSFEGQDTMKRLSGGKK